MAKKVLGSLGKHKLLIGGLVLGGLGLYAYKQFNAGRQAAKEAAGPVGPSPFLPSTASRSYLGYGGPRNPGLDDLDNQVNWVAAGNAAGLDPSPYSYLTERNENPLLSHVPFPELTGGGGRNFEAMKFQGSYGLTTLDPHAYFTYW